MIDIEVIAVRVTMTGVIIKEMVMKIWTEAVLEVVLQV
jgi:hypothetical protein